MSNPKYRCSNPILRWYEPLNVQFRVRCRECPGCLRLRQYQWMARAAREQARAKRVWFITLTFGPAARASIFAEASAAIEDGTSPTERLVKASGGHVARYIKRLRKASGSVRYLLVPELHRDGFPHWHGLLFWPSSPTYDDVKDRWGAGFSVVKLVRDIGALCYVTKYLSKENIGRVRCSFKFGAVDNGDIARADPSVEEKA